MDFKEYINENVSKNERKVLAMAFMNGLRNNGYVTSLSTLDNKQLFNSAKKLVKGGYAEGEEKEFATRSSNQGDTSFGRSGVVNSKEGKELIITLTDKGIELGNEVLNNPQKVRDVRELL